MVLDRIHRRSLVFPTELIDEIVELLLAQNPGNRKFASIAPLALASTALREIALRRFFFSLHLRSSIQWTRLHMLLTAQGEQALGWVRQVHANAETLSFHPARLHALPNLQAVTIIFSNAGVATQQTLLRKIVKLPQPYLSNPPSPIGSPLHAPRALFRVTSLTLTALPFIDKSLLIIVAKNFPNLTYLYLCCTDRLDLDCCWSCFQESASCAIGISPIPDMFADVEHLASTFATALKPLNKLTHLHLGVFLSDEALFNSHFSHVIDDRDLSQIYHDHDEDDRNVPFGPESCVRCCTAEALSVVRDRELVATKIMAKRLKCLQSVGWSTVFRSDKDLQRDEGDSNSSVGDPGRSTTRWVLRKDAKLYLQKRPW